MTGKLRPRAPLKSLLAAGLLAACGPPETAAPAPSPGVATLTVGSEPQQTFQGFGFSFELNNPYGDLSEARKAEVDRLLFEDLNARIIRLWYTVGEPEPLRDDFLARGIIPHALAHGVKELLLAPGSYLGSAEKQARQLAEDIAWMRKNGIKITTTGVINEPDAEDWKRVPPEHYGPLAKVTRRELDARELQDVKLLGPEFASADANPVDWFDTIATDPQALAAVDGLATHSYGMAANRELAERVIGHRKQYWMTEAGGGRFDGSAEFDYVFAASVSSRFLNDINNGVTHWVWFIGLSEGTRDVRQKLLMCEGRCADTRRIYKNYSYHHAQQVSRSFPPGTVMRHVTSNLPDWPDMVWTYGPKPPLHAAAGIRADGRWALAVVNDTPGITAPPHNSWDPPATYTITYEVPELASVPNMTFDLCRTNAEVAVRCAETVTLEHGKATFEVQSLELITLVAREPVR